MLSSQTTVPNIGMLVREWPVDHTDTERSRLLFPVNPARTINNMDR